ncbi:hypothetical protein NPX13_g6367 [Xylaria arbuscula]|uniref:Uncharacterized protein n=1 Tax=Xylaria arbuscula TaxID=114810 RepID=A0A9W8NCM9_9PEZI|nr:hypothetical protein NPX13_g6367 [Xylaria arbuscula]
MWYFDFQISTGANGTIGEGGPGLGPGREKRNELQTNDVFSSMSKGPYLTFTARVDSGLAAETLNLSQVECCRKLDTIGAGNVSINNGLARGFNACEKRLSEPRWSSASSSSGLHSGSQALVTWRHMGYCIVEKGYEKLRAAELELYMTGETGSVKRFLAPLRPASADIGKRRELNAAMAMSQ